MSGRGTLEALLGELQILMQPLIAMTPGAASGLLVEVGLPISDAQAGQIGTALSKTTHALSKLTEIGFELEQAITDKKWEKVITKGISAIDQIAMLIDGFDQLESSIATLQLPNVGPILAAFPARLFSYLLARYLGRSPWVNESLELTGLLDREDHNVGSTDPLKPFFSTYEFKLDRLGGWITKPGEQLADLWGWNTNDDEKKKKLLQLIDRLVAESGLPSLWDGTGLDLVFAKVTPSGKGFQLEITRGLGTGAFNFTGNQWTLGFELASNVLKGTTILLLPTGITVTPPEATTFSGSVGVSYSYLAPEVDPLKILSLPGGSKLSVEELAVSTGVAMKGSKAEFSFGADLKRGKALFTMEEADGFIGEVLGGFKIENNFDLGVTISSNEGVHFHGSSTLEIQLASHISLGPIELDALTLTVGIKDNKFPVGIVTDITANLGPLVGVVQGIGFALEFSLAEGNSGNLGPLNLEGAFVPPKGVGLSLDLEVVKGGGYLFFDTEKEEYAGALELNICNIVDAKAIGIITTKMPDGSKGFSLLIIISAEFSPAFQLGYGFTLNGVGGLLGVNRSANVEALRAGVKNGGLNSILFPKDVVAHAPQIISDLRTIFPAEEGVFLIGPMAKLGWGAPTLVSLSLGIILELPSVDIGILGVLRVALPTEDNALVNLQVNFLGWIDWDKGLFSFDASLYDSRILFITLEGDMAVRFKWKEPTGFLFSIGGFHPSYQPPVEWEVPEMKRLSIYILNEDYARIGVQVYFALTSNTLQTGCKCEVYFGFDGFYVDGYLAFDALIQFSPFHLEIGISAGLTLHVIGIDLLSIRLAFNLSGPKPWRAWGTGTVTIIGIDISADFDITWGEDDNTALPGVEVMPKFLEDVNQIANWKALPPKRTSSFVTLRGLDAADNTLVLHPVGALTVRQKVAPMDLTWDKIGNQKPTDARRCEVKEAWSGAQKLTWEAVSDEWARTQYEELSDANKLSAPSFEKMHSGVKLSLGGDVQAGAPVTKTIDYEQVIIDKDQPPQKRVRVRPIGGFYGRFLQGNAVKRAAVSQASKRKLVPFADKIVAGVETYTVAGTHDNRPFSAASTFQSEAQARDFMDRQITKSPSLRGHLHVLPAAEVNRS